MGFRPRAGGRGRRQQRRRIGQAETLLRILSSLPRTGRSAATIPPARNGRPRIGSSSSVRRMVDRGFNLQPVVTHHAQIVMCRGIVGARCTARIAAPEPRPTAPGRDKSRTNRGRCSGSSGAACWLVPTGPMPRPCSWMGCFAAPAFVSSAFDCVAQPRDHRLENRDHGLEMLEIIAVAVARES